MDGEDKEDTSDEDYGPEQNEDEDSEDREEDDSNDNDDDGDYAPETEVFDDDVGFNKQDETIPGADQEIPGVGGTKGEISGVYDAKGTPGLDDTTPEVDDEATPGVDDDAPNTANKSDEAEIK